MTAPAVRIEALREQLEASLADVRLSDDEKRALTETLRAARLPEEGLRQLRNQAFELVRQHLQEADPSDPQALVRWLEGVVRALDVSRGAGGSYRAQAWFSPGDDCLKAITGQLRACRQRADICVFTLSDDRISAEVLAAHRRGVAVRLITDNEKAFDRGSDVIALRDAGVPVRVDQSAAHMHHKFALFDQRWLLNGSYNWTRAAATENEENLVLCNDPALLRQFAQAFDALWEQLAVAT
jgi:phosphatidylserine/phosphatidylglycerophosphate/cardiolipin synthase-like enzyme